jgi:hypothetical protein
MVRAGSAARWRHHNASASALWRARITLNIASGSTSAIFTAARHVLRACSCTARTMCYLAAQHLAHMLHRLTRHISASLSSLYAQYRLPHNFCGVRWRTFCPTVAAVPPPPAASATYRASALPHPSGGKAAFVKRQVVGVCMAWMGKRTANISGRRHKRRAARSQRHITMALITT